MRNTVTGRRESGFTLIEVLIAVALVGILRAVAIPSYASYVMRGRLTEAFVALSAIQPKAEEFWSNNRTYEHLPAPASSANFDYAVSNDTASSYTVTATGKNAAASFSFTIDHNGNRATTGVPAGWASNANCWIDRKGGQCVQ
jgi:type IV pilus assembly protein PilE